MVYARCLVAHEDVGEGDEGMEEGNLEGQRGEKRTVGISVKAESPDDQRALKEDWVASVLLVLRSIRGRDCVW